MSKDLVIENRQITICAFANMFGNSFGSVQYIPPFVLSLVTKKTF